MIKADYMYDQLMQMFPDAHCELNYKTHFELLIAVVLSAQTTDKSVNKITVELFKKYPDAKSLACADLKDVENCIKSIGLYKNKAKNIVALSQQLQSQFDGVVPNTMEQLTSLPGVGRKTANVILSELFDIPAIAVDTHVARVSKRLKIAKVDDDVAVIEKKLQKKFDKEKWHMLHHLLIFFGRYHCTAKNPKCDQCPFVSECRKEKNV